jgi:hypothetical protein
MVGLGCRLSPISLAMAYVLSRSHTGWFEGALPELSSTDLFLALALAMAFFTPCSAILTQTYGKSIRQVWLIFA